MMDENDTDVQPGQFGYANYDPKDLRKQPESPDEGYERERNAFVAWWESDGQKKFSEAPTLAAGAGWLARADALRSSIGPKRTEDGGQWVDDKEHWSAQSESGATDFSTHKFHGKVEAGDTQAGPSCRTASAEREKAERARARLDLEPDGPQPSDPEAAALWWMDRFIDMKALAVQLTEESLSARSSEGVASAPTADESRDAFIARGYWPNEVLWKVWEQACEWRGAWRPRS